MTKEGLKLTVYFGERDRVGDRFLADALADLYARSELRTSIVLRGAQGFGPRQHLSTDRLLSLSEDLPLASVAVDEPSRIEPVLAAVTDLAFDGLVTVERAQIVRAGEAAAVQIPWVREAETKLTVFVGRQERIDGAPAHRAVVAHLRERGVAGATVLLGVDGTLEGARQRARFFSRNEDVPLMIIAVGDSARIAEIVPGLAGRLARPRMTLERLRVCRRDGIALAEPRHLPEADAAGLGIWQKLMIYSSELAQVEGRPLHEALVDELRHVRAAGATSLRGIWGYHGDHPPHGDSFWQLRRRVPVVTVIVDTPARIRAIFEIVARLTARSGLVTSEMVPAYQARAAGHRRGGLRLAQRLPIPGDSASDRPAGA